MNSQQVFANSKTKLKERFHAGRITWTGPILIVFARLILAVLAQGLVAGFFLLKGSPAHWQAAAPWWVVYGTLIDICCLLFLIRLTRREGIRLFDLISFDRKRLGRDLLLGLVFIALFIVLTVGAGFLFAPLIYGTPQAPSPYGALPLWGALYSLLVWPIIWAVAEQITYQGYSLPRLQVLSGRGWLAPQKN